MKRHGFQGCRFLSSAIFLHWDNYLGASDISVTSFSVYIGTLTHCHYDSSHAGGNGKWYPLIMITRDQMLLICDSCSLSQACKDKSGCTDTDRNSLWVVTIILKCPPCDPQGTYCWSDLNEAEKENSFPWSLWKKKTQWLPQSCSSMMAARTAVHYRI